MFVKICCDVCQNVSLLVSGVLWMLLISSSVNDYRTEKVQPKKIGGGRGGGSSTSPVYCSF